MGPIVRKVSVKEKRKIVRGVENIASRAIRLFDRRGITKFSKLMGKVASSVLTAYMGFRDPKRRRREYLIPKDKAAWLEWLVSMAKKRIQIQHLTEKELRKVIIRARPNLAPHKKYQGPVEDPDLPLCIDWDVDEVASWLISIGYPQLEETFRQNFITGRRLVLVDCTALNQMGMTDLGAMREVAGKIRELLGIPPPNGMRPIARAPPFERFLRRKVYNGRSYDGMTFEKFCEVEGYNYELLMTNKNAKIPCTCEVYITTRGAEEDEEGEEGEAAEELSLRNAPTVEFLVRNALVRNKTVEQIMEDLLQDVFRPPLERKWGRDLWGKMKRGIGEGFDDLHLIYSKEKLEFVTGVANALIDELYKTVAVLNDINQLQLHIKENITKDELNMFTTSAQILMEEVAPIAGLLALGELDLETIFKQEPQFEDYVDGIIRDAEGRTNELVPDARSFIDEVIEEAMRRIPTLDLTGLAPETRDSLLRMAYTVLHELSSETAELATGVEGKGNDKKKGARGAGGGTSSGQNGDRPVSPAGTSSSSGQKDGQSGQKKGEGVAVSQGGKRVDERGKSLASPGDSGKDKHDPKGKATTKGKKVKHDDEKRREDESGVESPVDGTGEGEIGEAGEGEAGEGGGDDQAITVATALHRDGPIPRTPMTVSTASSNSYNRSLRSQDGVNTPVSRQNTPGTRGSRQFNAAGVEVGKDGRPLDPSKDPRTSGRSQASGDRQGQGKTGDSQLPSGLPKGPGKSGGASQAQGTTRQSGDSGGVDLATRLDTPDKEKALGIVQPLKAGPGAKTMSQIEITLPGPRKTFNDISAKLASARNLIPVPTPPPTGKTGNTNQQEIPFGSSTKKDSKGNDIPRQSGETARDGKNGEALRESGETRRDSKGREISPDPGAKRDSKGRVISQDAGAKRDSKGREIHPDQHGKKHVVTADNDENHNHEARSSLEGGTKKGSLKKTRSTTFAQKDSEGKEKGEDAEDFVDSAKEIWDNFKSQVSHMKISENKNDEGIVELEINPEDVMKVESTITKLKLKRARTLVSTHDDMKVDPEHMKKMMAHRKTMVEHWAKTEMEEEQSDTSPEEQARLVRMTADKVVTEICTMALTHMLLEAEAGKNTGRIIHALKKIELKGLGETDKSKEHPNDVTLWHPNLPGTQKKMEPQDPRQSKDSTKPPRRSEGSNLSDSPSPLSTAAESLPKSKQGDQQKKPSTDTQAQQPRPKPILQQHGHGGTDKLKSQSKTVVMNAVKDALKESASKQSISQRTPSSTAVKKTHYVTRL
ncbi:Sterile alpha motif domain-containing protein 15 [Orchesella cincta]|uniref:Sterile alpha motif domain-containing protein 15 n=1 Tax=Orchesella cincta TaxID=48709 RepID=A0A1D2MFI2_ORCCI|nr:Sterile alpha motif domain-containing protein 15 [Orchesella cincta]